MKDQQRFRIGLKSGIMFVIVIAILITGNLLLEKANISWDLSQEKIYSISDQTKSILNGLDQEVTIYILSSEEDFPMGFAQVISEYQKQSSNIEVLYRSLSLYPGFASKYMDNTSASVAENSMIVVCGEKHVYVDSNQYVNTDGTLLNFEPMLTSAINTVVDGETKKLYYVNGHNELELLESTRAGLLRDNYEVQELMLLQEEIPADADVLMINAPTEDYSIEECEKLQTWLDQGGSIYCIVEATIDLDHLFAFAKQNGIEVEPGIVLEQDVTKIYGDTPTYILPNIEDHEITKDFDTLRLPLLVLVSKGLRQTDDSVPQMLTGLLSTSNYAYSKVNLDSDYVSREDLDITGPFYLAMLSEAESGGKLLVLGSSNVLNDDADELVNGRNTDFVVNGIDYMMGDTDKISIRGKTIEYNYNLYSEKQVLIFSGIAILGIPILVLLIGVIIVVRRNHRSRNWMSGHEEISSEVTFAEKDVEEETEEMGSKDTQESLGEDAAEVSAKNQVSDEDDAEEADKEAKE